MKAAATGTASAIRQQCAPKPEMRCMATMLTKAAANMAPGSAHTAGWLVPRVHLATLRSQRGLRGLSTATRVTIKESPAGEGVPRIVIVGGGFGGLYTAVRLGSLFWPKGKSPQVTLVDKAERFTFKPLLYELLNGGATEGEVAPSFTQLLAPYPVRFIQSQLAGAEPDALLKDGGSSTGGRVMLEGGGVLEYDWLVLAMGSQADPRGVPGVIDHAVPFNSFEDALRVRSALEQIEARGAWAGPDGRPSTVAIVGAGYAGVELAAVVAERLRNRGASNVHVQLITPGDSILSGSPAGQREAAEQVLANLGVEVLTGTRVLKLEKDSNEGALPTAVTATLSGPGDESGSGRPMGADIVLWTAGSAPATSSARAGLNLPTNNKGALVTDPTLRVRGHARVFALGDVCVSDSSFAGPDGYTTSQPPLPATAQVAFQQADYVAWNVWAAMMGRPLLPFRYQHLGSMMALGAANAAIALPVSVPLPLQTTLSASPLGPLLQAVGVRLTGPGPDQGSAGGVVLEGPLGALVRRAAYLYRQPTGEQRVSVATEWLTQAAGLAAAAASQVFPGTTGTTGQAGSSSSSSQ